MSTRADTEAGVAATSAEGSAQESGQGSGQPSAQTEERALELAYDVLQARCPSRHALEHMTGRWGTLIMLSLRYGPVRFNELRRRVDGISEKMLSQGLQALERDGFVAREVLSTMPPRVEYRLTELGVGASDLLKELARFLEAKMPEVEAAQAAYDEADGSDGAGGTAATAGR